MESRLTFTYGEAGGIKPARDNNRDGFCGRAWLAGDEAQYKRGFFSGKTRPVDVERSIL
jgi:hypothetical protein